MFLCLNYFPENDGIYDQVIPGTMVQGKQKPNISQKRPPFGRYYLVYIGMKNNMIFRCVTDIVLRKSYEFVDNYFMTLSTGKLLHSYRC